MSEHIEQVCELIIKYNLKDIILVGHSYGGMVITGVASQMANRIRLLVYLDAAFPEPKQSLCNLLALGGFDPVTILSGLPKAYTEKLEFDPQLIKVLPKIYIFCTKNEFKSLTNLMREKIVADDTGWKSFDLPSDHTPQATVPGKLTKLLLRFCD